MIAALAVAGTGIGVELGQSSVAEINPIYFTETPQTRFFTDMTPTPYRLAEAETPQPADYWVNDFNVNGRPECIDCPDNFVEPIYAAVAVEPTAMTEGESTAPPADAPRQASPRQLDRYMNFRVSSEQQEAPQDASGTYAEQFAEDVDEGPQPRGM